MGRFQTKRHMNKSNYIGMRGIHMSCRYMTIWLNDDLQGLTCTTYTNKMHHFFGDTLHKNSIVKRD